MAERICFLGRGGSGKSTIAQNLSHALAKKGYHVLLVGNDLSLSSTVLLRGDAAIMPALEGYREKYEIDLDDYVIKTQSGVWCLELGSIDPGVGCLARGISLIDEMLDTQGLTNTLQIDFILYDISGETPCTGYALPLREGLMQRCIIVTNGSFAAVAAANSLLQAVCRSAAEKPLPIQLFVNNADCCETKAELTEFAKKTNVEVLAFLDHDKTLEYSTLAGYTVLATDENSAVAKRILLIADCLLAPCGGNAPTPFTRESLLPWLREWQKRELARRLALEGVANV
ncbi:MAG: hypothetical protein RR764_04360 [Oscillospiraceae bacterium]